MSDEKIAPDDKGAVSLKIYGRTDGIIIVEFGTTLSWLGMGPLEARQLATSLLRAAHGVDAAKKKAAKDAKRLQN